MQMARRRLRSRRCAAIGLRPAALGALLSSPRATASRSRRTRSSPGWSRSGPPRPEFISPLVDHLPMVAGIPTPKDVLGYHIGAPEEADLHRRQLSTYYRALERQDAARQGDQHRHDR